MTTATKPFKAAVIQAAAIPTDSIECALKAASLIREAASNGAKVQVFPEAFLGGYPKGNSFGSPIGLRKPTGRADYATYYQQAIDLNGEEIEIINEAVRETGAVVVIGCIERDGGTLYCTALYFSGKDGLVGKHRKLMPTALERLVWGFGDGSTLQAVDTPWGRLGAVICWENYMPALRLAMYQQRVTIYCAPTADDRDSWQSTMQHIALEGRCFVLSSCQHLRRKDFPSERMNNRLPEAPDTVLMRGGSSIHDPLGKLLAGPVFGEDALLTAELDLSIIPGAQMDFDPVGHYARPDVFSLHVNTAPQRAVQLGEQ